MILLLCQARPTTEPHIDPILRKPRFVRKIGSMCGSVPGMCGSGPRQPTQPAQPQPHQPAKITENPKKSMTLHRNAVFSLRFLTFLSPGCPKPVFSLRFVDFFEF